MPELPLADRTIAEVGELLRARELSSRELVDACLARIERDAERLNTFLAVGAHAARAADPLQGQHAGAVGPQVIQMRHDDQVDPRLHEESGDDVLFKLPLGRVLRLALR